MFWKNKNGEDELVTPYLDEGLILPGITRNSILVNFSFRNLTLDLGKRNEQIQSFRKENHS